MSGEPLRPAGPLTMGGAEIARMLAEGRARAATADLTVDLSAVPEADSAALALLLDLLRTAGAAGHSLVVRGLPDGLRSLAALYGIDTLLPIDS